MSDEGAKYIRVLRDHAMENYAQMAFKYSKQTCIGMNHLANRKCLITLFVRFTTKYGLPPYQQKVAYIRLYLSLLIISFELVEKHYSIIIFCYHHTISVRGAIKEFIELYSMWKSILFAVNPTVWLWKQLLLLLKVVDLVPIDNQKTQYTNIPICHALRNMTQEFWLPLTTL